MQSRYATRRINPPGSVTLNSGVQHHQVPWSTPRQETALCRPHQSEAHLGQSDDIPTWAAAQRQKQHEQDQHVETIQNDNETADFISCAYLWTRWPQRLPEDPEPNPKCFPVFLERANPQRLKLPKFFVASSLIKLKTIRLKIFEPCCPNTSTVPS